MFSGFYNSYNTVNILHLLYSKKNLTLKFHFVIQQTTINTDKKQTNCHIGLIQQSNGCWSEYIIKHTSVSMFFAP